MSLLRVTRTKAIIQRAHYNYEDNVLKEKQSHLNEQKQSQTQLRQRQEDSKVAQMKRAHLAALRYMKLGRTRHRDPGIFMLS